MSLSSINFASYQNAITNAYTRPAAASTRVAGVAGVTPSTTRTQPQTTVATSLARLLTKLASGDVDGSRAALSTLTQNLRTARAASDDDGGAGFARLLTHVLGTLDSGETAPALAQIQNFLLDSGRATGTAFSATV